MRSRDDIFSLTHDSFHSNVSDNFTLTAKAFSISIGPAANRKGG